MAKYSPKMEAIRHELFTDLIDHVNALLKELGIPADVSEQAGVSVADFLAQHWSGQVVSIPQDYRFTVANRDLEMLRWHKGDFFETARHFGMSDRGARKALERVTRAYTKLSQGTLFDDDK